LQGLAQAFSNALTTATVSALMGFMEAEARMSLLFSTWMLNP